MVTNYKGKLGVVTDEDGAIRAKNVDSTGTYVQNVNSDSTADVRVFNGTGQISSTNPLDVTVTSTTSGTPYREYATILGTYNTEATIISYTVPVGKIFSTSHINLGGDADGEFSVYIETVKVLTFRNSAANRTQLLPVIFNVGAEETIDIKVTNVSHRQNASNYEATIIGGIA